MLDWEPDHSKISHKEWYDSVDARLAWIKRKVERAEFRPFVRLPLLYGGRPGDDAVLIPQEIVAIEPLVGGNLASIAGCSVHLKGGHSVAVRGALDEVLAAFAYRAATKA